MPVEMRGAFEVHDLPNGCQVFYRDSDHSYHRDIFKANDEWKAKRDDRLAGVTTVIKHLDPSADGLIHWGVGLDRIGTSQIVSEALSLDDADEIRTALAFAHDPDRLGAALVEQGLDWQSIRDDAAARGTRAHEHALAELAAGKPVPNLAEIPESERGFTQAVWSFFVDAEPECLLSEQLVASRRLGVAGRADLLCKLDGQTVLLDLKSAKVARNGKPRPPRAGVHAQLAGYRLLGTECLAFPQIDRMVILQVTEDGQYHLVEGVGTDASFLSALDAYRAAQAINRDASASRKAEKQRLAA